MTAPIWRGTTGPLVAGGSTPRSDAGGCTRSNASPIETSSAFRTFSTRWSSLAPRHDPGILIDHNSRPIVHIIEPGTKFEAEDSVLHWYFSTAVAIIPGHESAVPLAKAKEEAKKRKTHDRSKESEHKHYMRKRAWLEHRKAKLAAMGIDTSTMSLRSSSSKYASLRSTSTPQFERGGL